MKQYYIYIVSNKNRTVLYLGYTEDFKKRISQHKKGFGALFTKKYSAIELVYFETFKKKMKS